MSKARHPEFNLQGVFFRDCSSRFFQNFQQMEEQFDLHASFRVISCDTSLDEEKRSVEAKFSFEFAYLNSEPKKDDEEVTDPALSIKAEVVAIYLLGDAEMPSEEELHGWAVRNSLLHVWPYWREYCHSTQLRMGAPLSIMPLMHPRTSLTEKPD